jgi:septal ring factor EnvC (AmiA/AmiB activator)
MIGILIGISYAQAQTIQSIEKEIDVRKTRQDALNKEAEALAKEANKIRNTLIALSKQLKKINSDRDDIEARLASLEQTNEQLSAQLKEDQASLVQSLAALQMLEHQPPPAFAVHPDDALQAVQGAIALAGIVPALQNRAEQLNAKLSELTALRKRIQDDKLSLATAESEAKSTLKKMDAALAKRQEAEQLARKASQAESDAITALVQKAGNLRELSRRLSERQAALKRKRDAKRNTGTGAFSAMRGTLSPPLNGKIKERFGELDTSGQKRQGLTITGRPGAPISAPFDATVLYAGPFRQYGDIVILGIDEQYQILLAGMERVYGFVGQDVLAGEPIGNLQEKGDASASRPLYMELRDRGRPIDPLPWLSKENRG